MITVPGFLKHASLQDLLDYLRKENAEELAATVERVLKKEIEEAQEDSLYQISELEGDIQELQRKNDWLEKELYDAKTD